MTIGTTEAATCPGAAVADEYCPTALYRFFDSANRLLYVGITSDPFGRFDNHCRTKPWRLIARIEIEWFDSRALAEIAEATAIRDEGPVWNLAIPDAQGKYHIVKAAWRPKTDEHRRLVAEAVAAKRDVDEAEARLWAALAAGKAGGVPVTYLVEQTGLSRATAYRHMPKTAGEDAEQ